MDELDREAYLAARNSAEIDAGSIRVCGEAGEKEYLLVDIDGQTFSEPILSPDLKGMQEALARCLGQRCALAILEARVDAAEAASRT